MASAPLCSRDALASTNREKLSPQPATKIPPQPDLFAEDATIDRQPTLAERYEAWRETDHGGEVWSEALDIALQMLRRGFSHYSIEMIWNVIRHHRYLEHGPDSDGYKLNNNYKAFMARELMEHDSRLAGFFETREQNGSAA